MIPPLPRPPSSLMPATVTPLPQQAGRHRIPSKSFGSSSRPSIRKYHFFERPETCEEWLLTGPMRPNRRFPAIITLQPAIIPFGQPPSLTSFPSSSPLAVPPSLLPEIPGFCLFVVRVSSRPSSKFICRRMACPLPPYTIHISIFRTQVRAAPRPSQVGRVPPHGRGKRSRARPPHSIHICL